MFRYGYAINAEKAYYSFSDKLWEKIDPIKVDIKSHQIAQNKFSITFDEDNTFDEAADASTAAAGHFTQNLFHIDKGVSQSLTK